MSWLRFSTTGVILGTFLLVGAGCVSQPVKVRRPVYPPKKVIVPPRVQPPPPAQAAPVVQSQSTQRAAVSAGEEFGIDRIARRLAVYEGRLYQWRAVTDQLREAAMRGEEPLPNGWEICLQRLENTYGDYDRLRRKIVTGSEHGVEASSLWDVVDEDFAYQESGCAALFRKRAEKKPAAGQVAVADLEGVGAQVCEAVRQGKYKKALDLYGGIEPAAFAQGVGVTVLQAYVVALLRTNRIDDALAALSRMLEENGDFDSWVAQRQVADLLLATGKLDEARAKYEALNAAFDRLDKEKDWVREQLALLANGGQDAEQLSTYGQALRSYLTFDGKRVPGELKMWVARLEYKYPGSDIAGKARRLLNQVENESRTWISDRLLGVDAQVDAGQYKKALAMLEDLVEQDLPKEMLEVVRKTMDDVVIAAAREQEEKRLRTEEMLQERWLEAEHLFDSEQFDDAIVVFSSLFGTADDVKARVKIGEAAALAAAKLRREGATLFFKAGQTEDAGQKRELLLQSRQLLQTILSKYPYVELVEKVARNLQIIDEQLQGIVQVPGEEVEDGGSPYGPNRESDSGEEDGAFPW